MAETERSSAPMEIAHVLFIDIVGYSKLLMEDQQAAVGELNQIARGSADYQAAEAAEKLVRIPTGDGMSLVFFSTPEAPVRCAVEMSRALRRLRPDFAVRMGIHSGPVTRSQDKHAEGNIAGAGINLAQRVMDCGDGGHILLSERVADDLAHYRQWQSQLHDLGEVEVKHGLRVHVFNLYNNELGNPEVPEKLRQAKGRTARRGGEDLRVA